ncbi:hypothetical protein RchiOBHm_Chr5g0022051 [Rosa chinensis]|uniref:Uncharacterized protein n=1 Tax=Rosa chinensis TaxID=74649 RepID=A0A2P6Q7P3_ROSCH|nr:hypothetical protein RchiOBHm_Chr5g0022051 [Rosa chinensis]
MANQSFQLLNLLEISYSYHNFKNSYLPHFLSIFYKLYINLKLRTSTSDLESLRSNGKIHST